MAYEAHPLGIQRIQTVLTNQGSVFSWKKPNGEIMQIQSHAHRPHANGYIYVDLDAESNPAFNVSHTYHGQNMEGGRPVMAPHPVALKLNASTALKAIPVKVLFDTPDSNIVGRYEAWSEGCPSGPVCIGDGDKAKAYDASNHSWQAMPCRGPAVCPRAAVGDVVCSFTARMQVEINEDSVAGKIFEFRTNSLNTYKAISGGLHQLVAMHGGLRHLCLSLVGWVKSSPASNYEHFACAAMELAKQPDRPNEVNTAWENFGANVAQALLAECVPTEMEMQPIEPVRLGRMTDHSGQRRSNDVSEPIFARAMQLQGTHSEPAQSPN